MVLTVWSHDLMLLVFSKSVSNISKKKNETEGGGSKIEDIFKYGLI